jgi:ABC-2 type transport system permease protein
VRAIENTGYFDADLYVDNPQEAQRLIDSGRVQAGFIIPPTFSTTLSQGQEAVVQLLIDGSDPTVAQTALFGAQAAAQAQAFEIMSDAVEKRGLTGGFSLPLSLLTRVLYNPDMKNLNFMVPGLVGMILQTQSLMLTTLAIVRERELGTLEQLIVTPIKPLELMLGKTLPAALIALANMTTILCLSVFWFKIEFQGSLLLFAVLSSLFLFSSLGIGLLISTVSTTQMQAMQTMVLILLPSIILSGFMFPRESMPRLLYNMGYFIPLTYFLQITRGIILKGVGIEFLWGQVWPLAIFGLAVFTISARRFQKRLE